MRYPKRLRVLLELALVIQLADADTVKPAASNPAAGSVCESQINVIEQAHNAARSRVQAPVEAYGCVWI